MQEVKLYLRKVGVGYLEMHYVLVDQEKSTNIAMAEIDATQLWGLKMVQQGHRCPQSCN